MFPLQPKFWLPTLLAAIFLPGCSHVHPMNTSRPELVGRLRTEMFNQTSWLRIHAAEALLDNGESADIIGLFKPEAETAPPPYRIGVWRVLARATTGPNRRSYIEKIRSVLRDPAATDRVSAAESLGKLDAVNPADTEIISRWLTTADDATAVYPRWLLCLPVSGAKRDSSEDAVAKYLGAPDPVARLRAGFVLGRLKSISPQSVAALRHQFDLEPTGSIARIYLITAILLHPKGAAETERFKKQLLPYLRGRPNEQLEAGIVLGLVGNESDISVLRPNLENSEPDARIGAANGILRLLK
jgi:HEAT repeat protein